ncbi:MAG: hypothetical protein FJX51_09675 [Alphaproteobacteria bacterium]|nr:hypothetical protein [Alphaproteobacteria bacterium]
MSRAGALRIAAAAAAAILLVVAAIAIVAQWRAREKAPPGPDARLFQEAAVGDATARLYDLFETIQGEVIAVGQRLVVVRGGQEIYRVEDRYVSLEVMEDMPEDDPRAVSPEPGANVLGGAERHLTVFRSTGGAHCCGLVTVLALDPAVAEIGRIESGNFPAHFAQLDDDPALEVVAHDNVFAYWRASFAESAAPRVVLKYDREAKAYVPAPALMRRPPPEAGALEAEAARWRAQGRWRDEGLPETERVPSGLIAAAIDLIYAGNLDVAVELINRAWPEGRAAARAEFLNTLVNCRLRESAYWPGVARLNGLEPAPPAASCPKG